MLSERSVLIISHAARRKIECDGYLIVSMAVVDFTHGSRHYALGCFHVETLWKISCLYRIDNYVYLLVVDIQYR